MDTWSRLTAVREDGGGVGWMKEAEGISQRTSMTHRHRKQCVDGQRERGAGAGWRLANRGNWRYL